MDIFLQIIKDTAPDTSLEDIQKPIRDIGIDSIDLVVIRVELEKYYGRIISDKEWFSFTTLEQVYSCFATKNATVNIEVVIAHKTIEIVKNIEITMPQMANSALSENWLLKDLGDAHWKSLSDGLETKSAELKDQDGNRLYATFTRISYTCSPIGNFKENEILEFKGSIKR